MEKRKNRGRGTIMANSNGRAFKLGERLAGIEGELKVTQSKIDGCVTSIDKMTAGFGARVQEHGEAISRIDNDLKNIKTSSDHLYAKIKNHVDGHWKFVSVVVGLLTIATIVLSQWVK